MINHTRFSSFSRCAAPTKLTTSELYCRKLVHDYDRENFLVTNLLNHEHQRIMYALRALNIEIANSTGKVTSEHTALGRLLFWENEIKRKALSNSIAPTMQRTPVSTELDFLKENYKIPTRWILRLVEARKNRLEFGRQYQTFKNRDE